MSHPYYAEFGSGKRAVLLSPVLPEWDYGAYFEQLTRILNRMGYGVIVFDTLSLVLGLDSDLIALSRAWGEYLRRIGKIDLLGGAAMGGSVIQTALGGVIATNRTDILLLSSPTLCDEQLKERLSILANTAARCGAVEALKLLSHMVRPVGSPEETQSASAFSASREANVVHRLTRGFEILMTANATTEVMSFEGRLLHLYGQASHLVGDAHVMVGSRTTHRRIGLPGCGMRPLTDALPWVEAEVTAYLHPSVV